VAATADAERLERTQLSVDRAVSTGNPFAAHAVARDDSLPLEQQFRERAGITPFRLCNRLLQSLFGEEFVRQRPASLRRSDLRCALARETARPSLRRRRLIATAGPKRRPRAVADLAPPHEVPERGQRLGGLQAGRRNEDVPELRAVSERGADAFVRFPFGRRRAPRASRE